MDGMLTGALAIGLLLAIGGLVVYALRTKRLPPAPPEPQRSDPVYYHPPEPHLGAGGPSSF
jgi:hypothetical protein